MEMGYYDRDNSMQKWYEERLAYSKSLLSNYEKLNELFNNFHDYEHKTFKPKSNVILMHALFAMDKRANKELITRLNLFEESLRSIDLNKLKRESREHLVSSLKNDDYHTSFSAFIELGVALDLAKKIGFEKISLSPLLSNNSRPDIAIEFGTRKIYFEVTSISEGKAVKNISKILTEVAEHIGKKINRINIHFTISIDPSFYVTDELGHIDVNASVNFLCKEADRIRLHEATDFEGFIWLDFAHLMVLMDQIPHLREHVISNEPSLKSAWENSPKRWLQSIDIENWSRFPFVTLESKISSGFLVAVDDGGKTPFLTNRDARTSFVHQLQRRIEDKMSSKQREPGYPNVLAIQGLYPDSRIVGDSIQYNIYLGTEIRDYLDKIKPDKLLSGIIFYTHEFRNGVFVENPCVEPQSKLTKNELDMIGIRVLKTDDIPDWTVIQAHEPDEIGVYEEDG